MDRKLALTAELKNNVSPKLRQIGKDMKEIRETPGMSQANKWFGEVGKATNEFTKGGVEAASVISGIGLGGLTAAASLATLVTHFKSLAEQTLAMKELGRETGLTIAEVKSYGIAAQSFGVGSDVMQGMLDNLSRQLPEFRRGFGELHDELAKRFPQTLAQLQTDLAHNDFPSFVKDAFNFLGQTALQNEPQLQKKVAQLFFGSGDVEKLFAQGPDAFIKAQQDILTRLRPQNTALEEQAEAFRKASASYSVALDNLQTKAGPTILHGMQVVLEDFTRLFENLDRLSKWWDKVQGHPGQIAEDIAAKVEKKVVEEATPAWVQHAQELKKKEGLFSPAQSSQDGTDKLSDYEQQRAGLKAQLDHQRAQSKDTSFFDAMHQADLDRIQELTNAINELKGTVAKPSPAPPSAAQPDDGGHWYSWSQIKKHISNNGDGQDDDLRKNIDFRPDDGGSQSKGSLGGLDFGISTIIADGTRIGVLAAFREWAAQSDAEHKVGTAGGFMKASFETGGLGGSGAGGGGGFPARGGVGLTASSGILDMIRQGEVGTLGSEGFKTITGQWHGERPDVTQMTVDQVLAFQRKMLDSHTVTDSAVGGYQINGSTLRDFKARMHLSGSEKFNADLQTRMAKEIFATTGGSITGLRGRWSSLGKQSDEAIRRAVGNGMAVTGGESSGPGGPSFAGHIGGQLKVGNESFRFGSGGQGNNSIPFGDYPITPGTIGAWGSAHGALGINNNAIYDQALKRMRTGIELHAGHSAELFTEGCVAFEAQQWPHVKAAVLGMIKKEGHAYLHVGKDGASISSTLAQPDLAAEARKNQQRDDERRKGDTDHSIRAEIHVKDRSGAVQRTALISSPGVVASMHRWPQTPIA